MWMVCLCVSPVTDCWPIQCVCHLRQLGQAPFLAASRHRVVQKTFCPLKTYCEHFTFDCTLWPNLQNYEADFLKINILDDQVRSLAVLTGNWCMKYLFSPLYILHVSRHSKGILFKWNLVTGGHLSFFTWHIILLVASIRRWVHWYMDTVSNNTPLHHQAEPLIHDRMSPCFCAVYAKFWP